MPAIGVRLADWARERLHESHAEQPQRRLPLSRDGPRWLARGFKCFALVDRDHEPAEPHERVIVRGDHLRLGVTELCLTRAGKVRGKRCKSLKNKRASNAECAS